MLRQGDRPYVPPWAELLYAGHHAWTERCSQLTPLTPAEALARHRLYGILDAWEWWGGGRDVAWLARKLLIRSLTPIEEKGGLYGTRA